MENNTNLDKYYDYSNNSIMNRLYTIFILSTADNTTQIACLENIDTRLKFMYNEGYILSSKLLVFSSTKKMDEIKEVLTDISTDNSFILLDVTDNITSTLSFFQVEKVFKKNQKIKNKFDDLISKFKKDLEVSSNSSGAKEDVQTKVDKILDNISKYGITSLTIHEKKFLDNNSITQ
jgi:hypothetical protein